MADLDLSGLLIRDVQLVIFDKDGTLMDLYHYWSQMIALRAELMCEELILDADHRANLVFAMGVDQRNGRLRPEGPVGLRPRGIVMGAAVDYLAKAGHPGCDEMCTDIFRKVDAITAANPEPLIRPITGVHRLFQELAGSGSKIAIATTDISSRAELAMRLLGLSEMIAITIGADKVKRSKPDPEMVGLILDLLAVAKPNAVMVGDAMTDVEMGINAGLKASIGVCSGLTTLQELAKVTPYVVRDVSEIKVVVR